MRLGLGWTSTPTGELVEGVGASQHRGAPAAVDALFVECKFAG
jgi:hypothetical protein